MPLSTTLVVCPHVEAWQDFEVFEAYLRVWNSRLEKLAPRGTHCGSHVANSEAETAGSAEAEALQRMLGEIKADFHLEAFHPSFARWHQPTEGFQVGSKVRINPFDLREVANPGYKGLAVEVVQTEPSELAARKLAVKLETGEVQLCETRAVLPPERGVPMAENVLQQAPHPTVHLIARRDLDHGVDEVNRLRARNSEVITELGV